MLLVNILLQAVWSVQVLLPVFARRVTATFSRGLGVPTAEASPLRVLCSVSHEVSQSVHREQAVLLDLCDPCALWPAVPLVGRSHRVGWPHPSEGSKDALQVPRGLCVPVCPPLFSAPRRFSPWPPCVLGLLPPLRGLAQHHLAPSWTVAQTLNAGSREQPQDSPGLFPGSFASWFCMFENHRSCILRIFRWFRAGG